MNGIKDPTSHHFNLVIETDNDRRACRRALGMGGVGYEKMLAVDRMATPSVLGTDITEVIAQNLARISLGEYGEHGFSGLSRTEAYDKVTELSGVTEEFLHSALN